MATYVLIEFDNDEDASEFHDWLSRAQYEAASDATILKGSWCRAEVQGTYRKPTMFCECTVARKPPHGWTRGTRYNWWICTMCGKPSEAWANYLPNTLGRNLIE